MKMFAYVIMESHLHMAASSEHLADEAGRFKSYTARTIIDPYKRQEKHAIPDKLKTLKPVFKGDREHQFWREGNHPKQITSQEMMRQKIEYIHS